jgi:Ser/Thr protein kinase RdoA (MazF antagonist)
VKDKAEAMLGSRILRATLAYGGYAPSATYRLVLAGRRRAFFKASYPLPAGSGVRWSIEPEERRYRALTKWIKNWSPHFIGSFRAEGWHVLLMEDLGPATMPPWTPIKTRRAARSYAAFHRATLGAELPRMLSRRDHHEFGMFWDQIARSAATGNTATLARRREDEAREWLDVALPVFRDLERGLIRARPPFVLLHFDTRSDNVRLRGDRMLMFDWPYASVGPAEFDVAAFAQAVAAEGGPAPERVLSWYEEVLPLRAPVVDASVAGIAGYFADRAWRPVPVGLPRIRVIQRRQLKATLAWAARRFALPEPRWLAAVAD